MKLAVGRKRSSQARSSKPFLKGFLRSPLKVGTVVPSSRFLEERVLDLADISRSRLVVELGAGIGGLTRKLLAAMPHNATLLAIEIDLDFCQLLERIDEPRLIVFSGNAHDLADALSAFELGAADAVISGIPFSTMRLSEGSRLVESIAAQLAPGGRFVAYQFSPRVHRLARPIFGAARVEVEFRNIPPLRVYRWVR